MEFENIEIETEDNSTVGENSDIETEPENPSTAGENFQQ